MTNFIPSELKNLAESKERVMRKVMLEIENTSKNSIPKWRYIVISTIMIVSLMFFVFNEITFDLNQATAPEQQASIQTKSDYITPEFLNEQGTLYLDGITLGDTQTKVIELLGEKYTLVEEDGSGADFVMDYNGFARFYFKTDKVQSVLLMKVDKNHFDQLYNEYVGIKFADLLNDSNRYIYSKETNQLLKATTDVPNQDLYLYLLNPGPEILENPDYIEALKNIK